ncbi:DUF6438 domain-containing protein [Qipengyuania spongiae]|uniref:DUF6438 domain-containing protein n=1 Tax=Qipengyuania spongiae TaxID=2909673 RepID=A0ABY5T0S8_9SPHN|nr:DUF6438 domain-containing protein [Qipengyuania spongiae]UVI38856.1 DUF6438 domain-containing protein [Qipengyuania spongiae]
MQNRILAALALAPLAACATVPALEAGAERISFSAEPCYGFCPAFEVTAGADGEGRYEGRSSVKVTGARQFSVTPEEFAAFRDRLAPYRPAQDVRYDHENCDAPLATDMPAVQVIWREANGRSTTLDWYMGCAQPGLAENREAIYGAWRELPLEELVGADSERQGYARP